VIRIAGREMEIKTMKFKEQNYWYDGKCKGKKRSSNGIEKV
jgi:hypothetical protein